MYAKALDNYSIDWHANKIITQSLLKDNLEYIIIKQNKRWILIDNDLPKEATESAE